MMIFDPLIVASVELGAEAVSVNDQPPVRLVSMSKNCTARSVLRVGSIDHEATSVQS